MARALEATPGQAAVVGVDRESDDDPPSRRWRLDHGDLLDEAGCWQRRFSEAGLAVGDAVALSPSRGPNLAPIHLGALAAGLTVVPLNSSLTTHETREVLASSSAKLVVSSFAFAEQRPELISMASAGWWVEDEAVTFEDEFTAPPDCGARAAIVPSDVSADATALLLFTSGTTGRPKAVPLSHANLAANLNGLAKLWGRGHDEVLLHMLPAHHFHGLVLGLYGSLVCGGTLNILPRFEPRLVLDAIATREINTIMGVPTMYSRLLAAASDQDDLSGLRLAVSGSAPLPMHVWEAFRERFGVELIERYGLTETGIIASNPPEAPRPGAVGMPAAGNELAIRQDDNSYVAWSGEAPVARGEICTRGPSIMSGYVGDDEASDQALREGWFHTGDLGYVDEDGYLHIDGRLKDLIIVGGSNVIPGEVERALTGVDGVYEVVAAGLPDEDLGEIVAAFVVASLAVPSSQELESGLRAAAETSLAAYKRPRRYVFVPEVPRNAMGKVDRPLLIESANS